MRALVVIDVQKDFCTYGALAVKNGEEVVPVANALMKNFDAVILTQDWHPMSHLSFAQNHAGKSAFDTVEMPYGTQVLWPAHCIIGTVGAEFHDDLDVNAADLILRKGFRPEIDSYSAFFENDQRTPTGLEGYLKTRGVETVSFVGLATDFCVAWSAIDAARAGFQSEVIMDATRAIDLDGSLARAKDDMKRAGVRLI